MADIDADDRAQALDAFAKAGANAPPPATIPAAGVMGADGMGLRVVGAQTVAVKRDVPKVFTSIALLAARGRELVLPLAAERPSDGQDDVGGRRVDQVRQRRGPHLRQLRD